MATHAKSILDYDAAEPTASRRSTVGWIVRVAGGFLGPWIACAYMLFSVMSSIQALEDGSHGCATPRWYAYSEMRFWPLWIGLAWIGLLLVRREEEMRMVSRCGAICATALGVVGYAVAWYFFHIPPVRALF